MRPSHTATPSRGIIRTGAIIRTEKRPGDFYWNSRKQAWCQIAANEVKQ